MTKSPRKNIADTRYSLQKNLKELRCLHKVARISSAPEKTISEKLNEIVNLLPMAFEHPDKIWSRITNGGEEFRTGNYRDTGCIISADIIAQREKAGAVEIGFTGTPPNTDTDLLASEKILLMDAVAERLGSIIEHGLAQEALRESEEKFTKAFRLTPAVIAITSLEDGRIIEVNENFTPFTGYTREEAMGLTVGDVGGWHTDEERDGFIRQVETMGGIRNMEAVITVKNGEKRTVLLSADLISFTGKPCVITVTQDITQQKHSQEFLQSVSDSSPLAVYILQDEKLKYINLQFQTITGYTQQDILDTDLLNIVHSADKDVVRASTVRSLRGEKSYPCEYRILRKDGQIKWVLQMVAPIHYNNRQAILGNLMDITERKYLERKVTEYEELDKMKGDILATVSHELRTPLAAIKGYATMMLDHRSRIKADEMMEYLISINNSADKLTKLVDNLLDTSRLDSGMLELKKSPASISALIKSVVKTASVRISSHRITTVLPTSLPQVNIDKRRITQVLENLIFNAAEYSPDGAEILISAVKKNRNIEISITDHGAVIPANEIKSIFDRMYKIENREYGGTEGMGLGLHICQRLVEAHGGKIRAESEPVKGTTIYFTLPCTPHKKHFRIKSGQNKPVSHIL